MVNLLSYCKKLKKSTSKKARAKINKCVRFAWKRYWYCIGKSRHKHVQNKAVKKTKAKGRGHKKCTLAMRELFLKERQECYTQARVLKKNKPEVEKFVQNCVKKVNSKYWFCRREMLTKAQRRKTRLYTKKNAS